MVGPRDRWRRGAVRRLLVIATMSPSSLAAEPYPDAPSHLRDHLARIERLLDGEPVLELDHRIAAREDATRIALPLRVLRYRIGLGDGAIQLLVLAALPDLDGALAGRLRERSGGHVPTVGALIAIFGIAESDAHALIETSARTAPLLPHGLVELSGDDATPVVQRTLLVDARIAAFLRGQGLFDQVAASTPLGSARSAFKPVIVTIARPETTKPDDQPAIGTVPSETERQLGQILASARQPGETIEAAYRRKEHELGEVFARLTPIEARELHRRLSNPAVGDVIATLFARLVAERRTRLLGFLAGARRRHAIEVARPAPAGGQ